MKPGAQTHDAALSWTSTTQLAPFLQRCRSYSEHARVVVAAVSSASVDIGLVAVSDVATDPIVVACALSASALAVAFLPVIEVVFPTIKEVVRFSALIVEDTAVCAVVEGITVASAVRRGLASVLTSAVATGDEVEDVEDAGPITVEDGGTRIDVTVVSGDLVVSGDKVIVCAVVVVALVMTDVVNCLLYTSPSPRD